MPAKHTLHVALTDHLVGYVQGRVADGISPSASDVVRLALETLIDCEKREVTNAVLPSLYAERRTRV